MRISITRLLALIFAVAVTSCIVAEFPDERDAGACGLAGTPCCRLDAGIRLDASGLMSNGCGIGLTCLNDRCQACPSGQQLCNGACVSVNDNSHCGACGNVCAVGFTCMTGVGDAGTPSCERVCPPGQNRCGSGSMSICTDLTMDTQNCGTCSTSCAARMLPNVATPACSAGMCAVGTCATNFANCDMASANGCEVNTQASTMHCGGCGRACVPPANATPTCSGGTCDFRCLPGFSDCDRNPTNGCETNLNTDANNCMMCGRRCPVPTGRVPLCMAGVCSTGSGTCPMGTSDCNGMAADGCETDLYLSTNHCGACGTVCSGVNGTAACRGGACVFTCATNYQDCNRVPSDGCETNLAQSAANCGRCGNFCSFRNASATCMNGTCGLSSCSPGFADCNAMAVDGCEIDTRSNPLHCGRCGSACAAGAQCIEGACILVCPGGQQNCSGRCADLNTDNSNCGMCGMACGPGQLCSNGRCGLSCAAGQTNCSGACRDLTTDRLNCGACGRACASGESCVNSICALVCPSGQTACAGTCRDFTTDLANCGACGMSCVGRFANSTAACTSSACALGACTGTFANCDGNATNGCETNINSTVTHCGTCNSACTFTNAGASCANGRCVLGTCNSGFGNCDGISENGCETNMNSAVGHCGACGMVCTTSIPGLVPVCNARVCGTALGTCPTNFTDCDGNATNGCETNTSNTLAHCGACGQACARQNAAETCTGGVCVLGACEAGFGNCNGDAVDGCETNTRTSTTHCGGCGRPCFFANATAACTNSVCGLGICEVGFGNCDGNASNGCESDLWNSRAHCGACAASCPAGGLNNTISDVCLAPGRCNCVAGFRDCDTSRSNGCEANRLTDPNNCGACGVVCSGGTPQCVFGTCFAAGCGANGQACCGGTTCGSNLACVSGNCTSACGASGQPCCAGNACNSSACLSGVCQP